MRTKDTSNRNWLAAAMAAGVLISSGCVGLATSPAPQMPAPPPQPVQASVAFCNQTPSGCSAAATFSLGTLRDLAIDVSWSNVPAGTHTQTTEILDPGGGLFEVRSQAFGIADNSDGKVETEAILPVSGTIITQRRLTGTWMVRVSLDTTMSVVQTVQLEP